MRELIMCVVAVLNGASYELEHHAPIFIRSGGTGDQLAAIKGLAGITSESSSARHQLPPGLFSALELAVVELAIQMTLRVKVEATLIAELRELLAGSDAAVVELVGVVAAYNMVSRFLVALDVTPDQH